MTLQMVDEMYDALRDLYGSDRAADEPMSNGWAKTITQWALQDALITRYEYRRGVGHEAPAAMRGLITNDMRAYDSQSYYARRSNCTCGNCSYCCGSGDEDDRTDEEKRLYDYE